jgi:hypothetical protein
MLFGSEVGVYGIKSQNKNNFLKGKQLKNSSQESNQSIEIFLKIHIRFIYICVCVCRTTHSEV